MTFSSDFKTQELNKVQLVLHHAVQFIAISGKYLLEEKEDDSHTNMSWDSASGSFYGDSINNRARVMLHVPTLSLKISGPTGIELASFPLVGKTKQESLIWLSQALQLKQIDTTSLKLEMHYDIPEHSTDEGGVFPNVDKDLLVELANHRSIADEFCNDVFAQNPKATPARTWPHHFDHGVYVPLEFNNEESAVRSFSFGYAVNDSLVDEPYFYVTQWVKNGKIDYTNKPDLEFGTWLPEKLKGAALPLSNILKMDNQKKGIKDFLDSTIEFSKNI